MDRSPCQEPAPHGQRRVLGFPTPPAAQFSGLLVSQLILGLLAVHPEAARSQRGPWQALQHFWLLRPPFRPRAVRLWWAGALTSVCWGAGGWLLFQTGGLGRQDGTKWDNSSRMLLTVSSPCSLPLLCRASRKLLPLASSSYAFIHPWDLRSVSCFWSWRVWKGICKVAVTSQVLTLLMISSSLPKTLCSLPTFLSGFPSHDLKHILYLAHPTSLSSP